MAACFDLIRPAGDTISRIWDVGDIPLRTDAYWLRVCIITTTQTEGDAEGNDSPKLSPYHGMNTLENKVSSCMSQLGDQQMGDIVVDSISEMAVVDEAGALALQVGSREVPIGALVSLGFVMKFTILKDKCPHNSLLQLSVT
uniref:WGS project CBMI000000000 data, contig CS3069_c001288 n=1 Tax=Fusarium clavum TaxID=2594811 RepID=A0A090MHQ6_9HYPO|nr:unnamed protein product [Fusarium clavum]